MPVSVKYHNCIVKDGSLFDEKSFRTMKREVDDKPALMLIGKLKGEDKTTLHAYRFPIEEWSETVAHAFCKESKGKFEPAKEELKNEVIPIVGKVKIKSSKSWGELEVLGAPYFGIHNGKDRIGEYFSPNTDFMIEIGDRRPVVYFHGETPEGQTMPEPSVIGIATASRRDDEGLWFDVVLDYTKKFAHRVWDAAINGLAKASSGTIDYLFRMAQDGEILSWPFSELTLFDEDTFRQPCNELAVVNLKALYHEANLQFPKIFTEKSNDLKDEYSEANKEAIDKKAMENKTEDSKRLIIVSSVVKIMLDKENM